MGRQISEFHPGSGDVLTREGGFVDAGFLMRVDTRGWPYRWRVPVPFSPLDGVSFTPEGHVFAWGGNGRACLLDGLDGHVLWGPIALPAPAVGTAPSFDARGGLLVAERTYVDGYPEFRLSRFDRSTGASLWVRGLPGVDGDLVLATPTAILAGGESCASGPCRFEMGRGLDRASPAQGTPSRRG